MSQFKSHNNVLIVLIGSLVASVIVMALYMEPHSGELTRMGGYLENDFGWNLPQEKFALPLFKKAESLDEYDQYYDVVVLGDSFSDDVVRGWQNYLVAKTGWSVITFNMNRIELDDLLETRIYRNSPPKLFIYESIERNMISRHSSCSHDGDYSSQKREIDALPIRSIDTRIESVHRRRGNVFRQLLDPGAVFNYWRKSGARFMTNDETTEVHRFHLNDSGIFSSLDDEHMLVIKRDFKLKGVTHRQIQTAQCRLLELQNRIQQIEGTSFITLIFPDKTSVYANYIDDNAYADLSVISEFENTPGLNIVKLKKSFDNAVTEGVVDLYLPNDTHCGFFGYRLAAEAILETMAEYAWIE